MVPALAQFLDTVHTMTGAPWWMVISGTVVAVRAVAFPLTMRSMAAGSRVKSIAPFLQLYRKQNVDAIRRQDQGAMAATAKKLQELNKRYNTGFLTLLTPPIFQLVFGIWIFTTLRRMGIEADQIAGFTTEGLPWVQDLGASEYTLPLGMLAATLMSTELSKYTFPINRTPGTLRPDFMMNFGRVMAVVGAGVMTVVPSVSRGPPPAPLQRWPDTAGFAECCAQCAHHGSLSLLQHDCHPERGRAKLFRLCQGLAGRGACDPPRVGR